MYKTISATSLDQVKLTLRPQAYSLVKGVSDENDGKLQNYETPKDAVAAAATTEPGAEARTLYEQAQKEEGHIERNGYQIHNSRFTPREDSLHEQRPVTVGEVKLHLPALGRFSHIDDFFVMEDFFANNLANLADTIISHEKPYGGVLCPVNKQVFAGLDNQDQDTLIHTAKSIMDMANNLKKMIEDFNENFNFEFHRIKNSLRLALLMNVKAMRNLENSRVMTGALKDFKHLFENLNFDSLHELLDDINDAIFDYNEHTRELEQKSSQSVDPPALSHTEMNYRMLNIFSLQIDSVLHKLSDFIKNECSQFKKLVLETKVGFADFFEQYKALLNENNDNERVFEYEIILFDDHLKNLLMI